MEHTAQPARSAAQNGATTARNVSRLPLRSARPFGAATTAATPELSTPGPLTPGHIAALTGRGLDIELLVKLGVGASEKLGGDAIAIPYLNGEVHVGTKHRSLTGEKRFVQDVGSQQILYNIDCLRDETLKDEPLVITEGEADCWAALQAGYPRAVSVPGGAPAESVASTDGKKYAFLSEALLDRCETIILAVDGDGPGLNLRHDLALRLGAHRCKWVRYPQNCKDLNDALRLYGERGVTATLQRAQPMPIAGYYELDELPDIEIPTPHDCGMVNLGEHYKLRLGDFCVITGAPGSGKSSFINELCCRMAQKHGWKTVFASFEQRPQTDHRRALRSFYAEKLEKEMLPQEKAAADAWIRKYFGFIHPDDSIDPTVEWMLSTCKQAMLRKEAQLLVIDPWNELSHQRRDGLSLTEYTGDAIKEWKRFARTMNIHLIIAAHPAKPKRLADGKFPIPSLWDISDSAHWSNKADVGVVIHRADLSINETLIRVVKTRYNDIGREGEIKGAWNVDRTRYTVMEREAL